MKIIHHKFLALLIILLCTFTYLLNFFNKISECSLVFIFLALTANIICELYGKKTALIGLLTSVIINFGLLWNFDYYIQGRVINGLVLASLVSVLVSIYFSTSIFLYFKPLYNLNIRNFISLVISALADGIIMSSFFITHFTSHKITLIFSEEVLFKVLYSLVIYSILFFGAVFLKKSYLRNKI